MFYGAFFFPYFITSWAGASQVLPSGQWLENLRFFAPVRVTSHGQVFIHSLAPFIRVIYAACLMVQIFFCTVKTGEHVAPFFLKNCSQNDSWLLVFVLMICAKKKHKSAVRNSSVAANIDGYKIHRLVYNFKVQSKAKPRKVRGRKPNPSLGNACLPFYTRTMNTFTEFPTCSKNKSAC